MNRQKAIRIRLHSPTQAAPQKLSRTFSDCIEPLSLDEAFLDVTGSDACQGSATRMAQEIRRRVWQELGLVVSAGVAPKKFLAKIDAAVPEHLDVHLVCDNYSTHKSPSIVTWMEKHPRFHLHFTPTYSSWINQVERFFAYITADLLQRSDHRSVRALENDIRSWVKGWNENPKPFVWTKPAEQILESLKRLLQRTTGAGH